MVQGKAMVNVYVIRSTLVNCAMSATLDISSPTKTRRPFCAVNVMHLVNQAVPLEDLKVNIQISCTFQDMVGIKQCLFWNNVVRIRNRRRYVSTKNYLEHRMIILCFSLFLGCTKCKSGWAADKDIGCYDINECSDENICSGNQFCVNTEGSYRCMQCDPSCNGCHGDGPDMCEACAEGYKLQQNICINTQAKSQNTNENLYRYGVYVGLCVATYIIFQKNVFIASIVGVVVAIYVSVAEYILNDKTAAFDPPSIITKHLFGK